MFKLIKQHQHPRPQLKSPIPQPAVTNQQVIHNAPIPEHQTRQLSPTIQESQVISVKNNSQLKDSTHREAVIYQKQSPKKRPYYDVPIRELAKHTQDLLNAFLYESRSAISQTLVREVYNKKRLVEDRVYEDMTDRPSGMLQFKYDREVNIGKFLRKGLEQMLSARILSVQDDIYQGNVHVYKKRLYGKQDLAQLDKLNQIRLVRLKEGQLKGKIDQLKQNMEQSLAQQRERKLEEMLAPAEIFTDEYYSAAHPKTKEVEEWIKGINRQREERRKKSQQRKLKKLQLQKKREQESELERISYRSERHSRLKERFEKKKELKALEQKNQAKRLQQFRQFLKEYKQHKPLFRQKEQAYEAKVNQEFEKYKSRLVEIKKQYRPIDYEQINQHQRRYLEYKQDNQLRKQEEVRMLREREKNDTEYFRGKYRYQVLEELNRQKQKEDPKEIQKTKKVRQLVYADYVKSQRMPKIDPEKKREIDQKIERDRNPRRLRAVSVAARKQFLGENGSIFRSLLNNSIIVDEDGLPEPNQKMDGLRNLQALHHMMDNLKKQGKIKPKNQSNMNTSATIQAKPNYLKQLRQRRQKSLATVDPENETNSFSYRPTIQQSIVPRVQGIDQFQRVKMKAGLMDQRAHRREQRIRNSNNSISQLQEGKQLENEYLASIKAKISLLGVNEFTS